MRTTDLEQVKDYQYMIFDFDGTIGDSNWAYDEFICGLLEKHGVPVSPSLMEEQKTWDFPTACHNLSVILNGAMTEREIWDDFDAFMLDFYTNRVTAMSGVIDFIEQMHRKGVRKCIVSASPLRHLQPAMKHLNLNEFFEYIITPEAAGGKSKSQPDIFYKAMELMENSRASEYCVFDDSEEAVSTASSIGMFTVGIKDPVAGEAQSSAMRCDLFLDSFCDLLAM